MYLRRRYTLSATRHTTHTTKLRAQHCYGTTNSFHKHMAQPKIELFYDVVSPYAYIAFEILVRNAANLKYDLVLRPFFLGGVFHATGNKPPISVQQRAKYLFSDVAVLFNYYKLGTPVVPTKFPINSLKAQRVLVAVKEDRPELLIPLSRAFWRKYWVENTPFDEDSVIVDVLKSVSLSDSEISAFLEKASSSVIKDKLRQETEEAVSRGAFGTPSMFATRAGDTKSVLFFGQDRIEPMLYYLGLKPHSSL